MKKVFPLFGVIIIFMCGYIMKISYNLSGKAAWSYLISSVNESAWELYKPFAIAYIGWIIIELSFLRPSLAHFVSAKLIGLIILCISILSLATFCRSIPADHTIIAYSSALTGIIISQAGAYLLIFSNIRTEIFLSPLLVMLFCMVMFLLTLSFYPPHWGIFFDFVNNRFGR